MWLRRCVGASIFRKFTLPRFACSCVSYPYLCEMKFSQRELFPHCLPLIKKHMCEIHVCNNTQINTIKNIKILICKLRFFFFFFYKSFEHSRYKALNEPNAIFFDAPLKCKTLIQSHFPKCYRDFQLNGMYRAKLSKKYALFPGKKLAGNRSDPRREFSTWGKDARRQYENQGE